MVVSTKGWKLKRSQSEGATVHYKFIGDVQFFPVRDFSLFVYYNVDISLPDFPSSSVFAFCKRTKIWIAVRPGNEENDVICYCNCHDVMWRHV